MRRHTAPHTTATARARAALLLFSIAVPAAGCDGLLEVEPDPHTVPGDQIDDPNSLEARLIGAEADFFLAYDMAVVYGGLFTDELIDATGLDEIDERRVTPDNGLIGAADEAPEGIDGLWTPMQRAAYVSNLLQEDILEGSYSGRIPAPEDSPEAARMSLFAGYAKLVLGELFCTTAFNGDGPEYDSMETYQLAADEFAVAIDAANAEPEVRYAAYVGRARARLHLGDEAGALADARAVPADFEYVADVYSQNSQREENDIWNMLTDSQRFSVGPEYRGLAVDATAVADPRVQVFQDPDDPFAVDGSTELFQAAKYASATAPIRLASGDEAQYITAEILGGQDAVDVINAVRARHGIAQTFSSGDPDEILAKLMDERRRTLFLEGQRMGDLRRYLARHDMDLFPTGQGYGDQSCLPLPDAERENNPGI